MDNNDIFRKRDTWKPIINRAIAYVFLLAFAAIMVFGAGHP